MPLRWIACLTALLSPGGAQETDWTAMAAEARIGLAEAIDRGLAAAGEGAAYRAELERDEGALVWSIDVAQEKRLMNVVLDAKSGAIVKRETDDEDRSGRIAASAVPLRTAVETALRTHPGTAVEARLRFRAGRPEVLVRVLTAAGLADVSVDGAPGAAPEEPFTDAFRVAPEEWSSTGANPWFRLEPGFVLVLEGGRERLTITVLDATRTVDGVETRVVEEREEEEGVLVEVSRNFFAISKRTNDVFYFGEEVDIYEDGRVARHDGAWIAGEKGARWGLMMPGSPLLGARYQQETAPGVAMDRAEIVGLDALLETPAGTFRGCLEIEESSPLESGTSRKVYAPGVGLLKDGDLRLVRHGKPR